MNMPQMIPYEYERPSADEMSRAADDFFQLMNGRRSIRDFAADPVPRELIETAIRTASTAPSGAHRQPWKFVAVSDPDIKKADSRGGGTGRVRIVRRRSHAGRVAGGAGAVRDDLAKTVSGDRALDRGGV